MRCAASKLQSNKKVARGAVGMIKKKLGKLQASIGNLFKWLPCHPNDITLLSLVAAIAGAYFVFLKDPLGILFFLLAFAFDGLDGAVARAKKLTSAFGAYLDGILDRLVEFFALLPLFFDASLMLPSLLVLFFGSTMTAFSKAYADHREVMDAKSAAGMRTLLPRAERVIGIFLALVLFVYGYAKEAGWLLWAVAALSIVSFACLQHEAYKKSGQGGLQP